MQVAFFQGDPYNGAALADVSDLTVVNFLLCDTQKGTTEYINQAMASGTVNGITYPGLDSALTLLEWQAGTSARSGFQRACHCVFVFESSGFVLLNNTQTSANYWVVLYGNDNLDAISTDIFGGGSVTVLNAGLPATGQKWYPHLKSNRSPG